jgi:pSer/pThr/pTyr-binding forkhead associated (FHA) protein
MEVRLVIENGRRRQVFRLPGRSAGLGRGGGNAVRIPSADVSRQHCRLDIENGALVVEDLDSVNGTYLNGVRVDGRQIVCPGDRLEVGPVTFVVEYELTPDALERLQDGDVGEVELLEVGEDDPTEKAAAPLREEEEAVDVEPVEDEDATEAYEGQPLDLSFIEKPWQPPKDGDLRDILSHMQDGDEPPPKKKRK